jgi:rubredoxin
MSTTRRCPDCGVTFERMKKRTTDGFDVQLVTNEPKPGILGGLGAKEKLTLTVCVCPECGLVREYADPT